MGLEGARAQYMPPMWLSVAPPPALRSPDDGLPPLIPQDAVPPRRQDYTWEGAAIGAGVVGLLSALLISSLCEYSDARDSCSGVFVGGALTGAFVGGVVGGMIGGNIRKGPRRAPASEVEEP